MPELSAMMYDEPKTEADRSKRKAERTSKTNVDSAIAALMSTPNGRDFVWWLLSETHIGANPFCGDGLKTAFLCGELNVGQKLLSRITEVAPEGYLTLLKEKANGRRTEPDPDSSADPTYTSDI